MKHKWIYSTLLVPGLFLFSNKVHASTGDLVIDDFQVPAGSTVSVPVNVNVANGDIGGFFITLTYDKSVVNLDIWSNVTVNPAFQNPFIDAFASPNTSTITGINAPSGLTGNVNLANVKLTGVGPAGSTATVTVSADPGSFVDSTNTAFTADPTPDSAIATILAADPVDPFILNPQTGVPLSTNIDSNTITVSGLSALAPISIVGGEYSINGNPFTNSIGTVANGDNVVVRQMSSSSLSSTTIATLTIESFSTDFSVTTLAADITPDAFSFLAQTDVALSTPITSETITINGIDAPSPISVSGGEYSIDGGAFVSTAGTISNGQTVAVRQTSSASPLTTTTATLTIDSVNADFSVTTLAADITPDAFSFTAQNDVALNSPIDSNTITVSGIDAPTPISVINGSYSINGGSFTSSSSTVINGDNVTLRQTSSSSFSTQTVATLVIDGVSSDFSVTTIANVEVAPVLDSIGTLNAVINAPFTFTAKASDANGDTLTFSLGSNAPSGATIDPNTGVFSWTPTTLVTFTFDVIVTDGTLTDTKSAVINVTATPVVVTSNRGGNKDKGDGCDYKCEQFREYRRKYKSPENREIYFTLTALKTSNLAEFNRLQDIYLRYKKLSNNELSELAPRTEAEFRLFRSYNGYKHYRHLKNNH